ncbi:MAG TPA: valine--tRNA ligase, partial [Gammaproteobacteria bacterium]|nr:valine--tRNA ligase [Gammaproteobacteria bacterium]
NLPRSTTLKVRLADATTLDRERVERHASQLRKLAGIDRIELVPAGESVKGAATALLGAMRILVPLAGLIDVSAERDRLNKQLAKTRDDLAKVRGKLANQNFVANAPAEVVAKEHTRIAELEQRATQLEQQIARLAELS